MNYYRDVYEDKKNSLLNTTKEIITYMNELAGTDFRYTTKKTLIDMCENDHKDYKNALTRLKINKEE